MSRPSKGLLTMTEREQIEAACDYTDKIAPAIRNLLTKDAL